ncbi:SDR family oxidoreductase [Kaistia dalseonensis]|uniref:NAD(P)-dependent dehydrogenase (Short-subunit alcohol dehydrogenase family) n=1 Tax=Kaistia dalseonensis TaxID=410840 RepID=A0ABU0H4B5_9HYPH|nr:SDR family oxidoreductase [Kaistia dalseonensis]MCX5494570.1 SDR family oxidoreductase [Kaistia dalseonensis]MDQ0437150.1 NAD(P)-dependent dehydrogenase (short-subunit alcohol dehydrogenase family) [Kaistia dalseonensis]
MSLPRTILITGASSGIGYDAAQTLKARGWRVFATARKADDLARLQAEGLDSLRLDYADEASILDAADAVLAATGGQLDALFNNGAYGQVGAIEDLTTDVLRRQFEANLFGWHTLTRRMVPVMRAQGGGRIIQCSSILGLVAGKYRGAYVGSKYALEGLTDTLRIELAGSGIHVSLIEPGPIATRFTQNALANFRTTVDVETSVHRAEYQSQLARLTGTRRPSRFKLGPEAVTAALIHALESPRPRARYHVTTLTRGAAFLKRILPTRLMDKLIAGNS